MKHKENNHVKLYYKALHSFYIDTVVCLNMMTGMK